MKLSAGAGRSECGICAGPAYVVKKEEKKTRSRRAFSSMVARSVLICFGIASMAHAACKTQIDIVIEFRQDLSSHKLGPHLGHLPESSTSSRILDWPHTNSSLCVLIGNFGLRDLLASWSLWASAPATTNDQLGRVFLTGRLPGLFRKSDSGPTHFPSEILDGEGLQLHRENSNAILAFQLLLVALGSCRDSTNLCQHE